MQLAVKICGIDRLDSLKAAIDYGARFVGLVFYDKSPRALSIEAAAQLARHVPTGVKIVGLFVDADDEQLHQCINNVPLDLLQLHGKENVARCQNIKGTYNLPIIKALPVDSAADIASASAYRRVADYILFDAKPPSNVKSLPGGTGLTFDWALLHKQHIARPWFLAGGLNVHNVQQAVQQSAAKLLDVSSGVEDRVGYKCTQKIAEFLTLCGGLSIENPL